MISIFANSAKARRALDARAGIGLALLAAIALGGCSTLSVLGFGEDTPKAALRAVQVIAEANANRNTATALDLVFVYDPAAVDLLPKSGPAWFRAKSELTSAFPRGIEVAGLQIPPAYAVDSVALPARHEDAIRVVAYANYLTEQGQYPINLTELTRAVIRLKPASIEHDGE